MKKFRITMPERYESGSRGRENSSRREGHYHQAVDAGDASLLACSVYPDRCFDVQEWQGNHRYGVAQRFFRAKGK